MKQVTEETTEEKLLYRAPMKVTEYMVWNDGHIFPVCPRCDITFEREYQSFCDRCGQMLDWRSIKNAVARYPEKA